jgi:hypothetical protein
MCHQSAGAGFSRMHNARVIGLWKLQPRLQRKAWDIRQCVIRSVFKNTSQEGDA